jgi:hypothetical protein
MQQQALKRFFGTLGLWLGLVLAGQAAPPLVLRDTTQSYSPGLHWKC